MRKEFKTIDELVDLLESRGVETDEGTAGIIRREGYYPIVNGYKGPFLDREAMKSAPDDVYLPGTTFRHIHRLFSYDRELRQAVLPTLLMAESTLKNAVVYSFCERNRGMTSYLERSNYASAREMLVPKTFKGNRAEEHGKNMARLMRVLNGILSNPRQQRSFVRHYVEKHGEVPLWVLQNNLTFGNIAHFYQLQKRGVQNSACKTIGDISGAECRLTPHDILRAFDVLVGFRNICAHGERLYSAEVKEAHFSEMISCLSKVLPEDEVNDMVDSINALNASYSDLFNHRVTVFVASSMGLNAEESMTA